MAKTHDLSAYDDAVIRARNELAAKSRRNSKSTPEDREEAKRRLAAAKLERSVRRTLADAPTLPDDAAQRIAALLLAGGAA